MFKNALVYRIEHWDAPDLAEIEDRLAGARFLPCGATDPESSGFVEPRGENHGALAESVGGQIILKLRAETKAVPGGVVKDELERRLDAVEQETGRRPKGKRAKELKEEIVRELLPRAFPKRSATMVWIAPKAGLVVLGVTGAKKADAIVTRLVELLGGGFRLGLAQTQLAPATAMAAWLADKEAPAGFTIDRDCELKQPDSEKAAVRYARHTLELDEIGEHIRAGKLPTQLALTWQGRVSFVLAESMAIKRIKLLDGVLEQAEAQAQREGRDFDGDVALVTGEMTGLIADLAEALGGWQERSDAAPAPLPVPAVAPAAPAAATSTADAPWD
ncbi:recombination-associated protein RdgC [Rubrivivax gelatinosus]|uniref:Recombination-associated protein RdgC n=1 Tax=Rubrivivax gelatinosus TaxID=28068 RepID=A0A4R2M367_RUBGE|nr:recombination-associated protein RdgC [Rubrivivax gelatinosus]MBK1686506.1 recombination-associated protein RdgC [Rubrivivax gelatinosus]TCP00962.1 recombination associated protein RdgC [Rubrivivax gelatinosus]